MGTKDIRDAVEAELEFDPLVDDAERDAVVSAAWMAGGVMQVRDDLDMIG